MSAIGDSRVRFAVLILLLSSFAAPQSANSGIASTQHVVGTRKHYVGLPNFGEVTPSLFRGALPSDDGLASLKQMGIGVVVDMRSTRSSHEQAIASKLGMDYISIPWHCPFPSDPVFLQFLKVIEENPDKKIFVHCRLGEDRTGMAIASYRMAEGGWSADEALNEMRLFGFNRTHRTICPTLATYERHFPEHLETNPAFKELRLRARSSNPKPLPVPSSAQSR